MSTIKSSDEHLTLNADGTSKDIKFQANGVEKASISSAGAFTSTTIDATKLTGTIPNFTSTGIDDNATSTAITIDSNENVGIGVTPESDWGSRNVLQFGLGASISGRTGSVDLEVSRNAKYTGNNPTSTGKYINADQACMYRQNGEHSFHVAPSGTADAAITWTDAMTINNSGYVTKGAHPNFFAYSNSGNVSYSSGAEIIMQVEGTSCPHFNTTTSRFTAPVAGFYHFETGIYSYLDNKQFTIKKNGSDVIVSGDTRGVAMSQAADRVVINVLSMNLAANDYVSVGFRAGSSGNIYGQHSWFSGYLIG